MAVRNVAHPSVDDRMATGGQARERTPPSGHAGWVPAADRPDPVALLEDQNLDTAINDFSRRYSDQNERDYQQFVTAIRSGRLEALEGV